MTALPTRARGFTLIEILVAMMVFLAGIAGVLALFSTGLSLHRDGLTLSHVTRHIDDVARVVQSQLDAGRHWDDEAERWVGIEADALPDGTVFSVRFEPERGNEREGSLLAWIRVASSEGGLAHARPMPFVLSPTPTQSTAVSRYRAQRRP